MESPNPTEPTLEQIDKFVAEMQAKRKDKPLTGHEESILIGAFVISQREHIPVLEAVRQSKQQARESHTAQQEGGSHVKDKAYLDTLKGDLKVYDSVIKLLSSDS